MKAKACEEVGITLKHVVVPAESTTEELVKLVQKLNADDAIGGILVQLPLGDSVGSDGERVVIESISPMKDVDGRVVSLIMKTSHNLSIYRFHAYNIGHLASRSSVPLFAPCTPAAVLRLLESVNAPLAGANVVILGRSDIVGSPVAAMLRRRDATVTQCHSRTRDIGEIVCALTSAYLTLVQLL